MHNTNHTKAPAYFLPSMPLLLTLFTFSFLLCPVQYGTVRLPRHNLLPVMPPLDCCFLPSLSCPMTLLQERSFWELERLARWLKPLPTFLEGLRFNSQHPDGNPQLNETPVPGDLLSFVASEGTRTISATQTCMQVKQSYTSF